MQGRGGEALVNLQNLRWPVVVATMAVSLGALFGGGYVLKNRTVDGPLQSLYSSSPGVESYAVEEQTDKYLITLKLKETPDFAGTYAQLEEETEQLLKGLPFEIKLEDGRTPALEQTQRRVNLYVQEALATGQFAAMADRVEAEAAEAGQTARLSVDNAHVYVELWGDGGYLYTVTDRPAPQQLPLQQTVERGGGQ